ncbi:tRNA (adenine(58)-N(1))-methyltransferase non-catalytic subunit TRM6-like [Acanthaster planci]|uniref:tRNA (adenine(58)-N(1))-methyltransferase non-catalytic subunit TRM6 n=1 Tax=Acanthaster planci TaxID=133434 RepID=A0A8B7YJW9_ACAPL|nr:tRNA (adenine(58)-N(1))-methyltransferase non-catalytic subunit TRM6-like [Acanthaster planci]
MASSDVIKQGQNVILKKGKSLRLYQVWRKRKVHLDKKHFYLDEAIGKPYGTTWDVCGHNVQLVSQDDEEEETREGGTDNRTLIDDKCSQKLSYEDIQALKNTGKHGEAIVEQLVENSSSFKEKTIYSQAKYVKRKRDKHLMRFQIFRPNTMLLCEMYSSRAPSKNIHLRIDTLAQILTAANIQSGINVIMMETCQGLLLGAVMERMAGKGTIVQIHSEHVPVRLAVEAYNFPPDYKDTLYGFPLDQISLLDIQEPVDSNCPQRNTCDEESHRPQAPKNEEHCDHSAESSGALGTAKESITSRASQRDEGHKPQEREEERSSSEEDDSSNVGDCGAAPDDPVAVETDCKSGETATQGQKRKFPVNPEKEARKQRRRENLNRVRDLLHNTKMDALVMACRFQPLPIFTALFKFLAPSRPFVIYCHYIEPLMECSEWLRNSNDAVNIRVTETWLREYQVLPERTHPSVNMSGTGGYLLTGTTVSNST